MKIKGVDMSYCQEGIDYTALKEAGVKFAIIRAGLGTHEDSLLDTHVKGCVANGIAYGFYCYSLAYSVEDAKAEAAACLKAISKYGRPAYPVFFDMEKPEQVDKLDRKTRTDMALAFCKAIEDGGYPAGVYANPAWLENYYDKSRIVGKYDIWLAHWMESPDCPSRYNYGQTMWQWGLDYIGMDIDGDICFIDYPAKTALWYSAHTQTSAQIPEQPTNPATSQPATSADLRKGDPLTLKNAPLYISSTAKNKSTTVSGAYYIYCDGVINNRIRITTPKGCKDCTGWVNVADCKAVSQTVAAVPDTKIKVGDTVRVKAGAKTYNGGMLMAFVYTQTYEVMQVGVNGQPDYVVIGQGGEITAAVHDYDLIK